MPLDTLLTRHARYRPQHTALVFEDERITFEELDRRVSRIANALLDLGLEKGDTIATVLENCVEVIELYHVAARTGLVVVPLSPLLRGSGLTTSSTTPTRGSCHERGAGARARPPPGRPARHPCRPLRARRRRGSRLPLVPRARRGRERGAACRRDRPRRPLQHHLLVGHHRPPEGHRAHARDPRGLLHRLRSQLPHPSRERRAALGVARVQRGIPDPHAGVLSRLHVRADAAVRRRPPDRGSSSGSA